MIRISKENLPRHVAIIPDGNRRWARSKNLSPWRGHYEGVKAFEKIAKLADELGLEYFSFWGASIDNILKRSKKEVAVLQELFRVHFGRLLKNKRIHGKETRVNIFGRWQDYFSARVKKPMAEIVEATKNYDNFFLNFFIMYDGVDEMVETIKKIVRQSKDQPNLKVTPELIKNNLFTKDLPPVDLLIRTGINGDPHNSAGFMMWDTAYSQLYFTETLWPAFSEKEFIGVLENYAKRERRMGA